MKAFGRPLRRYGISLAVVLIGYALYYQWAIPWIEGPPRRTRNRVLLSASTVADLNLAAWLPADAWELQPCKRLDTSAGHIFFKDYQPHDDGRVEVYPLTLVIFPQNATADSVPIVMRAPQGAVLKFDQPLTLGGRAGQLEGGMLSGEVTITRAATLPEKDDAWEMRTSNIQLNNQRIQTLQEVEFHFGANSGRGRHLMIDLEVNPLRSNQKSLAAVEAARRIELVHLTELLITRPAEKSPGSAVEEDRLRVTCRGSLEMDLEQNQARLTDQVEVLSINNPGDWLRADQLRLEFEGASPGWKQTAPRDSQPEDPLKRRWSVRTIVAAGGPARISLASRDASAVGEQLAYDLQEHKIRMVGESGVQLRQSTYELNVFDIEYQLQENGAIGPTLVHGPGRLTHRVEGAAAPQSLQWTDELVIEKRADGKSMALRGQVFAALDDVTQFYADQVTLDFLESSTSTTPDAPRELVPIELRASGGVRALNQRVEARVDELRAHWPPPKPSANPQVKSLLSPKQAARVGQPQRQARVGSAVQQDSAPLTLGPPIRVSGKTAELFLNAPAAEPALRELIIDGSVIIQQPSETGGDDALDIRGQRLQMIPQDPTHYRVTVSGNAQRVAEVKTPSMSMAGAAIQVDQAANRLWIDGAGRALGRAVQPVRSPSPSPSPSPSAPASASEANLEVLWDGGMVFDGQQIYFESNVRTKLWQPTESGDALAALQCHAINLSLDQRIDLSGKQPATGIRPEVTLMSIVGAVPSDRLVFKKTSRPHAADSPATIQRQVTDAANQLVSSQQMSVPWGQLNLKSGEFRTSGPGWVSLWQADGPATSGVGNPAAPKTDHQPRITQVKFDESIGGNINESDLTFLGNVRVIYGIHHLPQEPLDADTASISGDRMRLKAHQLRVVQWQKSSEPKGHVEIIASGQAEVAGESFDALAERISYDESQQRVVIEGDARNHAQLTYATTPGGPRNPLVATKIIYNLRDNTTSVEGFKHGVLTTGPVLNR